MPSVQHIAPNVLNSHCPSRQVLDLIADKWTVLVVHALSRGVQRPSELLRAIDGISQKMLTQVLRKLEADKLVARSVYPSVPPVVEYTLTPLGETLREPLAALCAWAEAHLDEIYQARAERDQGV